MSSYDKQYQTEEALFGEPYAEFEAFVKAHALAGGTAIDIGCGQGRDALMLARHGYQVLGIDGSKVGIEQMVAFADAAGLKVAGLVADFYEYEPSEGVDAVVLDSILHFEKGDVAKEVAMLDRLSDKITPAGYLFVFVHRSDKKEKVLHRWAATRPGLSLIQDGYIDYVYEEKASGFRSPFQFYMFIAQRVG